MVDTEQSAYELRRAVSDAELRGDISEKDALAYIEALYKIERALQGAEARTKLRMAS
jgi:hypothetical protein